MALDTHVLLLSFICARVLLIFAYEYNVSCLHGVAVIVLCGQGSRTKRVKLGKSRKS